MRPIWFRRKPLLILFCDYPFSGPTRPSPTSPVLWYFDDALDTGGTESSFLFAILLTTTRIPSESCMSRHLSTSLSLWGLRGQDSARCGRAGGRCIIPNSCWKFRYLWASQKFQCRCCRENDKPASQAISWKLVLEPYRGYSLPITTIINQHQEIQQMVGVAIYYFGGVTEKVILTKLPRTRLLARRKK